MKKANQEGGGNKVLAFFKRNIYFVLIIVCVLAIGTMITIAAVNGSKDKTTDDPTVNGGLNDDDDVNGDVDDDDDDNDKDDNDEDETKTFAIGTILDEYTVDIGFSNTELVFNPTMQHWATHEGLDMLAAAGSAVYCPFDGTVKSVDTDTFYGTTVVISHEGGYETTMRLLDEVTVTAGSAVKEGDKIGVISADALAEIAQGAHLHLELTKDGVRVDPAQYMREGDK